MTTQRNSWTARARAAWEVLHGGATADPLTRAATLELDLRDRDQEIRRLRQEYDRLQEQAERQQTGAAAVGFEALARRLAPLLSQLATMQALAAAGRTLRSEDILKLFGKVEGVLAEAGLVRVGEVGAEEPFDTRRHQRLSGADLGDGDPVTVRFVGYRLGETVLLKAMVSRQDTGTEPEGES